MLGVAVVQPPIVQRNNNQPRALRFSPVTKYHIPVQSQAVLDKIAHLLETHKNNMEAPENSMLKHFWKANLHETRALLLRTKSEAQGICDYRRIIQYLHDYGVHYPNETFDKWPT